MRKPSQRVHTLLAPLLEAAENVTRLDQPSPALQILQDAVFDCLQTGDGELLLSLLNTLRESSHTGLWEHLWRVGMHLASAKFSTSGFASVLVGIPLYPALHRALSATDRNTLTQVLRESGVVPPRGKLYWFSQPLPLPTLLELSPLELWDINTPGQKAPSWWRYWRTQAPVIQVLLGRLEYRHADRPAEWPEPYVLVYRQAQALGLPPEALGACQLLGLFLTEQLDNQRRPDPIPELLLSLVQTVSDHLHQKNWPNNDCRILLNSSHPGYPEIVLRGPHQESVLLATVELAALSLTEEQLANYLRGTFAPMGIEALWIPTTKPGHSLH